MSSSTFTLIPMPCSIAACRKRDVIMLGLHGSSIYKCSPMDPVPQHTSSSSVSGPGLAQSPATRYRPADAALFVCIDTVHIVMFYA